jgi:hypothetical protein
MTHAYVRSDRFIPVDGRQPRPHRTDEPAPVSRRRPDTTLYYPYTKTGIPGQSAAGGVCDPEKRPITAQTRSDGCLDDLILYCQ